MIIYRQRRYVRILGRPIAVLKLVAAARELLEGKRGSFSDRPRMAVFSNRGRI